MNSAHDVGGMHGFGPVAREEDEPVFHADWERSSLATHMGTVFQGLLGPLDTFRHSGERMGNLRYLSLSYYEQWLWKTEALLVEQGLVTADELAERAETIRRDPASFTRPAAAAQDDLARAFASLVREGVPSTRDVDAGPAFSVGDAVVTTRSSPKGHTRLPRYARGRRGTIVLRHGAHVFPDTNAHGLGECPQHLYTVRFDAAELWGDAAERRGAVHLDVWESQLRPAAEEGG